MESIRPGLLLLFYRGHWYPLCRRLLLVFKEPPEALWDEGPVCPGLLNMGCLLAFRSGLIVTRVVGRQLTAGKLPPQDPGAG